MGRLVHRILGLLEHCKSVNGGDALDNIPGPPSLSCPKGINSLVIRGFSRQARFSGKLSQLFNTHGWEFHKPSVRDPLVIHRQTG